MNDDNNDNNNNDDDDDNNDNNNSNKMKNTLVGKSDKPLIDNNNWDNDRACVSEVESISTCLNNTNTQVLICSGDNNNMLLKINLKSHFIYFVNSLSHSFPRRWLSLLGLRTAMEFLL